MPQSRLESRNPATLELLWHGKQDDLEQAITSTSAGFPRWASQPLPRRIELLRRAAAEIRRQADALARQTALETGRPLWDIHTEIDQALARIEAVLRSYSERCPTRKQDAGAAGTIALRHKPHGTIAIITPFAQPLATALGWIVPALLAGNTALWKTSPQVFTSARLLQACFRQVGIGAEVLGLVAGHVPAAMALAGDQRLAGVFFSGSAHTGQLIARKMASQPHRLLALSLGGNNPLVVWDCRQIEQAAIVIVQSAFAGAGQRNSCARRLIVSHSAADPLLAAVKRLADRITCGAPDDDPTPFMGPVISNETADALIESYVYLLSHGGRPIKHMQRLRPDLPFLSPAIIDVTAMEQRPDVELFGPLLQVIRVADFDAAIAQANASAYGLVAGLIGGNQDQFNRFWANVQAGTICWNRPLTLDLPACPQAGLGLSGNHRPGGTYGVDACSIPVSSAENPDLRAMLGTGFAPEA